MGRRTKLRLPEVVVGDVDGAIGVVVARLKAGEDMVGEEIGIEALDQAEQQKQVVDQTCIRRNPVGLLCRNADEAVLVAWVGARKNCAL